MLNKILSKDDVLNTLKGKDITFVSGSFDILHPGHLAFLNQAKSIAESNILLVCVLADKQIKRRKGISRPIFPLEERVKTVSYVVFTDYVIPWNYDWEELRGFVEELRPKILVVGQKDKGIENKRKIIESVGGKIEIITQKNDYSTTYILDKLRK